MFWAIIKSVYDEINIKTNQYSNIKEINFEDVLNAKGN